MKKLIKMPYIVDRRPATEKCLRIVAYCRVSIWQEEQDSSIEQQEQYYTQYIQEHHPTIVNLELFDQVHKILYGRCMYYERT